MIYRFNVNDGDAHPDKLGMECASLQDARVEAVQRIGRLLAEQTARFWTGDEWSMEVTDSAGLTLFTLVFMAANSPAVDGMRAS